MLPQSHHHFASAFASAASGSADRCGISAPPQVPKLQSFRGSRRSTGLLAAGTAAPP